MGQKLDPRSNMGLLIHQSALTTCQHLCHFYKTSGAYTKWMFNGYVMGFFLDELYNPTMTSMCRVFMLHLTTNWQVFPTHEISGREVFALRQHD